MISDQNCTTRSSITAVLHPFFNSHSFFCQYYYFFFHVASYCFVSSYAFPRNLILSSKSLFFRFNMGKKTVRADRAQCKKLRHNFAASYNVSQLFELFGRHHLNRDTKAALKEFAKVTFPNRCRSSVSFSSFIQLYQRTQRHRFEQV